MDLDITGIDHQPLKVRIINYFFQQLFPDTPVSPTAEPAMGVLPVSVIWG
jgi:hypothetical protein